MLDVECGLKSGGQHYVNLAFHAANAVLLFMVLRRMTNAAWRSAMVAALFAVHPLHVESVAWIAERKDVLSTLLGLLAIGAYSWYAQCPSVGRYLAVFFLFALGLMAKPMLVTLPCVFLLLDWWPLGRISRQSVRGDKQAAEPVGPRSLVARSSPDSAKRSRKGGPRGPDPKNALQAPGRQTGSPSYDDCNDNPESASKTADPDRSDGQARPPRAVVLEKLPLAALSLASCIATYGVQKAGGAVSPAEHIGLLLRVQNALLSYVAYLGKTLWPVDLAVLYPFPRECNPWMVAAAAVLLGTITALVLWGAARGQKYLAVGWLWYAGMLVPVIGLVQVGRQAMADRYTYLPLVGIFIAGTWAVAELLSRWRPRRQWLAPCAAGLAAAAVLVPCTALTARQVRYWTDTETLFRHAAQVTRDNAVAHQVLGTVLAAKGQKHEAIAEFREALRIDVSYAAAYNSLGLAFADLGQWQEAMTQYDAVLRLRPEHAEALHNLGLAWFEQEKPERAVEYYRRALARRPDYAEAHGNLGAALLALNVTDEALRHLRTAAQLKPWVPEVQLNLGLALSTAGETAEAVSHLRQALALKPDGPLTLRALAWTLATADNCTSLVADEAVRLAEQACRVGPRNPYFPDTLAAAYARAGRFREAVSAAREAADLAHLGGRDDIAAEMRARQRLYEAGQVYRSGGRR
jgi:tetratricopeptide (TPR) repeat protein